MELRSGLVLKFTRPGSAHCHEPNLDCCPYASKVIKDLKVFYRFLFFQLAKLSGQEERIEHIARQRPVRFYSDVIGWVADEEFWHAHLEYAQRELHDRFESSKLLEALSYLLMYDYGISHERYPDYSFVSRLLTSYVEHLYRTMSVSSMTEILAETLHVKNSRTVRDNKLYLYQFAKHLALKMKHQPKEGILWKQTLQDMISELCFISHLEGGVTVQRQLKVGPLWYEFRILETGKTFRSPERDSRKAYLLDRLCALTTA